MKKTIYLALMATVPFAALAQPTVKKAMDFAPGITVKFVNCDHIAPGPAGMNQTWDMSGLTENDTSTIEYLAPSAGNPFTGATLMEKNSDTTYQFYNKTNGGLYLVGFADSTNGNEMETKYSNSALFIKNQLTYGLTDNDTFASTSSFGGFNLTGKGTVNMNVDGYGTLKLPNGTYNNVLRVRVERNEVDTIPAPVNMSFNLKMITYMWFDTAHMSPLCRIDSNDFDGSSDQSASYLLKEKDPLSVANASIYKADFSATFSQNQLILNSKFNKAKQYEAVLFNISGQKVFAQTFNPQNNRQVFDMNTDILPGIYMLYLQEKGNPSTISVIKLAKQ